MFYSINIGSTTSSIVFGREINAVNTYSRILRTQFRGIAIAFLVIMPMNAAFMYFGMEFLGSSPGSLCPSLVVMAVLLMMIQNHPDITGLPLWKKILAAIIGFGLTTLAITLLGVPGTYLLAIYLVAIVLLFIVTVNRNRKAFKDERDELIAAKVKHINVSVGYASMFLGNLAIYIYADFTGIQKVDVGFLQKLIFFVPVLAGFIGLFAGKYYYRKLGTESDD